MNVIEQAEKVIESLHLPLSYDDNNNEIVTSKVETEYGECGSELYKYRLPLFDCNDKRDAEQVITALHLLPDLLAECKRLEAEAQDYHDQKEAALSQLVRERQELQAEAARWQAVAVRERAKNLVLNGGAEVYHPSRECMERAAAALGCQPRAWLMSEERIKALDRAARFIAWADHAGHLKDDAASGDADIIQAMLAEAKQ